MYGTVIVMGAVLTILVSVMIAMQILRKQQEQNENLPNTVSVQPAAHSQVDTPSQCSNSYQFL